MTCRNDKAMMKHSRLCEISYPYTRFAESNNVMASHVRDCTRDQHFVDTTEVRQSLGFEASMDLVSLGEFCALMDDGARFGSYCMLPQSGVHSKHAHFCVDCGRKTVDGRRLSWLWVYPDGNVRPAHKKGDKPNLIWTKKQIVDAYKLAANKTLPMWTRHVDQYSELAISFCLPFP